LRGVERSGPTNQVELEYLLIGAPANLQRTLDKALDDSLDRGRVLDQLDLERPAMPMYEFSILVFTLKVFSLVSRILARSRAERPHLYSARSTKLWMTPSTVVGYSTSSTSPDCGWTRVLAAPPRTR
jgi:hypothetical protein